MSSGAARAERIDWSRRATEPELLDEGVDEREALRSLADLRFVNRRLGGRRALRKVVLPLLAGLPRPSLLDVGCGSADMPAMLVESHPGLRAVGVDIKPLHVTHIAASVRPVVADARRLPFADRSFDVVTASLFLHHFDGQEASQVLVELARLGRRALVVNDLRRARVPYVFGRLFFPLLFASRVSVEDGLLSIRRAFTEAELRTALHDAGLTRVTLRRVFPYRLLARVELA